MAQPMICDVCGTRYADLIVSSVHNGDTLAVCNGCMGDVASGLAGTSTTGEAPGGDSTQGGESLSAITTAGTPDATPAGSSANPAGGTAPDGAPAGDGWTTPPMYDLDMDTTGGTPPAAVNLAPATNGDDTPAGGDTQ